MNSVTMSVEKAAAESLAAVCPTPAPLPDGPVAKQVYFGTIAAYATAAPAVEVEAKVSDDPPVVVLSLCLAVAVALIVGLMTVILSRLDAASHAKAVLCGGAAFGTTLLIGIAVIALF